MEAHPDPTDSISANGLDLLDRHWACSWRICVSQTGSLFSSDAWNNITFTAGEVRNPRRNLPLALGLGTSLVIGLYLLANVAYLVTMPSVPPTSSTRRQIASAPATMQHDLSRRAKRRR